MNLEIHYDPNGEWAALYKDGQLVTVGDAYVAEEQAFDLLGVVIKRDDAFMRGSSSRVDVAQTITEVEQYRNERDAQRDEAARLRQQAQELLDRANQIGT